MGLGTVYTIADSEVSARRFWDGWNVGNLALCRDLDDGRMIFRADADCELTIKCDRCDKFSCIGCGQQASLDITGGGETATCQPCWKSQLKIPIGMGIQEPDMLQTMTSTLLFDQNVESVARKLWYAPWRRELYRCRSCRLETPSRGLATVHSLGKHNAST